MQGCVSFCGCSQATGWPYVALLVYPHHHSHKVPKGKGSTTLAGPIFRERNAQCMYCRAPGSRIGLTHCPGSRASAGIPTCLTLTDPLTALSLTASLISNSKYATTHNRSTAAWSPCPLHSQVHCCCSSYLQRLQHARLAAPLHPLPLLTTGCCS